MKIQTSKMNEPPRIGANRLRKMVRVVEVDGSFTVLRAFAAPIGGPSDRSWLDDGASMLNAQVIVRRRN